MASQRLSRNDWINAAMNVLSTGGIDMVRVDNLAKELKITRGSFYYHFESRQDLLKGILDRWRLKATEAVIADLKKKSLSSKEQLVELMLLPLKGDKSFEAASIEISLRAWARRDDMARAAVDEVDRYRIAFIEQLFVDLAHPAEQANDLAYLVYSYMIATSLLHPNDSLNNQNARAKRLSDFLSDNCPLLDCRFRPHAH
jgi:AcrR family transcriptional regulator